METVGEMSVKPLSRLRHCDLCWPHTKFKVRPFREERIGGL